MAVRVTMPSGNTHTSFVINSVILHEGKCVICLGARGKLLEYIKVEDIEKGRLVRDMINGALNGERRYRVLDWSFLTEPLPPAPPQPPAKTGK